jgi:cell volume regulation protein A
LAGVAQADMIFNLVFFIVLTSVLLQGTTLPLAARFFGVDAPMVRQKRYPLEFIETGDGKFKSGLVEIPVAAASQAVGKPIVSLGIPEDALIVLVGRGDEFVIPNGGTVIEANDTLLVLAGETTIKELRSRAAEAAQKPE